MHFLGELRIVAEEKRKYYKSYVIAVHPEFLVDYQKWHISFSLERHHGSHVNIRKFYTKVEDKSLFDSEKDAIKYSFVAGAQTIDRGVGLEDM